VFYNREFLGGLFRVCDKSFYIILISKQWQKKEKIVVTMLAVGKKRVHKTRTFETKMDILKRIDNGEGHGEIARSLGLSRSTVSTVVKNRQNYGVCEKCRKLAVSTRESKTWCVD
jgi:hypothetical protein